MNTYTVKHGEADEGTPGTLTLEGNDAAAIEVVRRLVLGGFRNSSWATVRLSDGVIYSVRNVHGEAVENRT